MGKNFMRKLMLSAAALSAALSVAPAALAQDTQGPREVHVVREAGPQNTLLAIAAQGVARGVPDMATINLGVDTEGDTAAAALAANSQAMNSLMRAVRRAGVAERDVQTSNVSVNPQYNYNRDGEPPQLTGYRANNSVSVRVRDVDNLGRVIDAAVGAGGNTVNGVSFSYQDQDAQLDAARRDAMEEARRLAALYASAAGMELGRIVSISEGTAAPMPRPMMETRMMAANDAAAPPIAAGELETRVTVNVVFELE